MRTCKLRTCKLESYCFVPLLPLTQATTKKPSVQLHKLISHHAEDCTVCVKAALFALGVGPNRVRRVLWLVKFPMVSMFVCSDFTCLCDFFNVSISQLFTLKLRSCMGCPIGELLMPGCHIMSNISEMYVTSSCK